MTQQTSKYTKSNSRNTMKAIAFEQFGEANVLKVMDIERPIVKAGEVLVRISHASVNPVDWKIRKGYLAQMLPHVFPIIPGWDAAGVVESIGEGVKSFKVGDLVSAYTRLPEVRFGTYAEYISLPEDYLAKLPEGVSLEASAGVPLVALTALQALRNYSEIKRGSRVLVLNASGGVGSFVVQFAKLLGANVTATTGPKNVDYVRSLGADQVVDYSRATLQEDLKNASSDGFDFVLDAIGGDSAVHGWNLVKQEGTIVSIVDVPDEELAKTKRIKAYFHFVAPNGGMLTEIFSWISAKKIKLPSYVVRSVKEASKSQDDSENHHTRGKIVLKIDL